MGAAVQQKPSDITLITPSADISAQTHGGRAKCLQRLVRLDVHYDLVAGRGEFVSS